MICYNCKSDNLIKFDGSKPQCANCGCILYQNKSISKFLKIYFAHPLGSHPLNSVDENLLSIEEHIYHIVTQYPYFCPLVPTHNIGFLYNLVPYELGIMMCFKLLESADILVLCGDWEQSKGCQMEKLYAEKKGIKVVTYIELCDSLGIKTLR
jgi:hypothetical protein